MALKTSFALFVFFALVLLLPVSVFAQSDDQLTFRAKGTATDKHFNGGVMWTAIDGDKATIIAQWKLGRSLIHSDVLPISDCEPIYSICLEAKVTNVDNGAAAEPDDQFIIKIDPENKKQVIVGKSGFLENAETVLNINEVYKISGISTKIQNAILEEKTIESHAASLGNILDNGLFGIQIGGATAANTAISNDERAQSFIVHFSNGLLLKPVTISNFIKFQMTSSIKDERGIIPIYQFSDKPAFYLESLPTINKKDFYKGVNNWMTKGKSISPFDVSIDIVSGKGTTIHTWSFSRCELTGFGTYLQDITNLYQFSNIENAEIRERATFVCSGLRLDVP